MPVILKHTRLDESEHNTGALSLFNEDGELTLAGEVVSDFLEHADFSSVFEHSEAENYLIVVEDADDSEVFEEVLPGEVVAQIIDEDDLSAMFMHFLDTLGEHAQGEDASLEDKARLAVFEAAFLDEKFKRGAFRRAHKSGSGPINRMLGEMLAKSEVKRAKSATKISETVGRHKKKAKLVERGQKSRRGRKKLASLAASVGMGEGFVFGDGVPFHGAIFAVGANHDAVVEFDEDELDVLCGRFDVYSLEEMGKYSNGKNGEKNGKKNDKNGKKNGGEEDDYDESGSFIGRPSLSEGASIARSVMRVSGTLPKKQLDD